MKEKTDQKNRAPWIVIGILLLILVSLIGYVLVTGVPDDTKNTSHIQTSSIYQYINQQFKNMRDD